VIEPLCPLKSSSFESLLYNAVMPVGLVVAQAPLTALEPLMVLAELKTATCLLLFIMLNLQATALFAVI
jgi:hypothetical protein